MKAKLLIIAAIALLFTVSCQDTASLEELESLKAQMNLEEANKHPAESWHYDLALKQDWEVGEKILAEDIIFYHMDGSVMMEGFEAAKGMEPVWKSLENAEIKHHQVIAEGDYVMVHWDMAFDHNQEVFGMPPTGNRIKNVYGVDIFLIKDGKIKKFWQYYDTAGFMKQLAGDPES